MVTLDSRVELKEDPELFKKLVPEQICRDFDIFPILLEKGVLYLISRDYDYLAERGIEKVQARIGNKYHVHLCAYSGDSSIRSMICEHYR